VECCGLLMSNSRYTAKGVGCCRFEGHLVKV
jgi:hypothetical protein